MASTLTQSPINSSSQNSTEPPIDLTTEPPAKKQKSLDTKSVLDIRRILECPVCFKTPDLPDEVHFCSNGHLLCNGCHRNILDKRCQVCRSENWNGQNPLMKQILSALPKICPFQGCEVQFESNDRNNHLKICQYRLINCITDCSETEKFTFKDKFIKHLHEAHNASTGSNGNGHFTYIIGLIESDFDCKSDVFWSPRIIEYDNQTFIAQCYQMKRHFFFQVFIQGSL